MKDLFGTVRRRVSRKMRWALLGLAALAIFIPSLFMVSSILPSQILAQTSSNYPYPDEIIETIEIDTDTDPEFDTQDPVDYPDTVQGSFDEIKQEQEQLQSTINTCTQKKTQLYSQLVSQTNQFKQLEKQRDALDDRLANLDSDDKRLPALEKQRDQAQRLVDKQTDTVADTQEDLDDSIADCQDDIVDLQASIDEHETALSEQFDVLMEYEIVE